MSDTPKEWDTIRSKCCLARVTYHAIWSESRPWATFRHGSAEGSFATLRDAVEDLRKRGFSFDRVY